jgi:hypothetical protein
MAGKKAKKSATNAERKRLRVLSRKLRRLTTVKKITNLSAKQYDKLLVQLKRVDRSITKIKKIIKS